MYHPLDGILLNFAVPSNALETLLGQSGKAKPLSHGNTAVSYIGCMIRGYEKRMSGDYAGAIREFTDAIDLDPNAATTYILRGICRAELGQHFAAIADYDIAIRLDPADPDAYFMRGVAKGCVRPTPFRHRRLRHCHPTKARLRRSISSERDFQGSSISLLSREARSPNCFEIREARREPGTARPYSKGPFDCSSHWNSVNAHTVN